MREINNRDSSFNVYYRNVVGPDTLKGGYITCYGIDDTMKYLFIRHGDTMHLLNKVPADALAWNLGVVMDDLDSLVVTALNNGNGVPETYQVFDKNSGRNVLGESVQAIAFETYHHTPYFLYGDNEDSLFLYNALSCSEEGFQLPKEVPRDIYIELKEMTNDSLTIAWVQMMTDNDEQLLRFKRHQNP